MSWRDLEAAAPELARAGRECLAGTGVALLGTLRRDGSPRISPVEPYLWRGLLLFGSMSWSAKTRDLLHDPRCVVHSAVTAPDAGEAELKLYGRAAEAADGVRRGCTEGWWTTRPLEAATVFTLELEEATLVEWDLEQGEMTVRRWSSRRGYRESRRDYP